MGTKSRNFFAGVYWSLEHQNPSQVAYRTALVNGEPGLLRYVGGKLESAQSFLIEDGRIAAVFIIRNPDSTPTLSSLSICLNPLHPVLIHLLALSIFVFFIFLVVLANDLDLFTLGILVRHSLVTETHGLVAIFVAISRVAEVIVVVIIIFVLNDF